ncbi:hypothetical protein [Gaoshiqia sp. Z1-71]|uniref:hypothetical protein n=1 Tax=Gaoshiqia hydrogeniformans TaxID=3290090 RepID=UPI003BF802D1
MGRKSNDPAPVPSRMGGDWVDIIGFSTHTMFLTERLFDQAFIWAAGECCGDWHLLGCIFIVDRGRCAVRR